MMLIAPVLAPALALAALGLPQDKSPPPRVQNTEVFGDDPCPKGEPDEIVVCKRLPEEERYRMPQRFREASPKAGNQAWANRAETIDQDARVAGGLPNTCSPVGSGGQTGCTQEMLRQWFAERRAGARGAGR